MELKELAEYARERYHMEEEHKWTDFPGFSVLCHPDTGKWVALLMRQWDHDSGREIQRCDLKCGSDSLLRLSRPYLGKAIRMRGRDWIDIRFDEGTEPETVFGPGCCPGEAPRGFDRAGSPRFDGEGSPPKGGTFCLEGPSKPRLYRYGAALCGERLPGGTGRGARADPADAAAL